jgi:hypothetical protein
MADRGQPVRILLKALLLMATSASAQSPPAVDCDAVKNSTVPVELAYHGQDGTRTVVQTFRDKSDDGVVWSRELPPSTQSKQPVFVTKATYADGLPAAAELSTTYVGKLSLRTGKYTPDGLPKNFDRRSDLTYRMHSVTTDGDGAIEERTSTTSYKFKSEGTVAVGSCVLQAIHGEADITNDAGRRSHRFQLYFPELKILASAVDAEPIADSLSTVFSEIKHVN